MAEQEKWHPPHTIHTHNSNVEVTGNNIIYLQSANREALEFGAMIGDLHNSLFKQSPHKFYNGWGRVGIVGDSVSHNTIYVGDGSEGMLFMKDGPSITKNTFNAGMPPTGMEHTASKVYDSVTHAFGSNALKTDKKTIILPGNRDQYTFKFNNDASPSMGNVSGSMEITNMETGATNKFVNFNYVVFGGKEKIKDISNYIEVAQIKAEQDARAATTHTRGEITPVSESAPQQIPAPGNARQR